ncbi:MAG: sulfatase-like hydrolase/transferase [Candidatus Cryptobacteroides sp.]
MNKRFIFAAASAAFAPMSGNAAAPQQRPNILFILADDMGIECLGCYGSTYNTPHLDALAEEGITFTSAYSQPLSTPSRVELMTGKYNNRNYSEFGFLNQDQATFGNMAREAGYKTCISGKWQLGANSALPDHFGFDNYCLWQLNFARGNRAERYFDPLIESDGKVLQRDENAYGPDLFVSYIKSWISDNKQDPFFVYYPMVLVHSPFVETPDSRDPSPHDLYKNDEANFPAMVEYCDKMVGELVDFLKREGLYDNTLIIFTGDNGTGKSIYTKMKDGSVVRGGKGTTKNTGTHTPMIATFGGRQAAPYKCDNLIDFTDFLPTFAQAMDYKGDILKDIDGQSFLPALTGEKGKTRKWVFCHYDSFFNGADHPSKDARRFIRDHRYKLYSTGEFYDTLKDPNEKQNIAPGSGSAEAERSRKFLSKQLKKFPEWKAGDIPVEKVEYPELKSRQRKWKPEEA